MNENRQVATQIVPSPIVGLRQELVKMGGDFQAALPRHIPLERFQTVVVTAVQNNPELLECDRRSFWNACRKAAQDGLLPDGREGSIIVRMSGAKKLANWQIMVAGIRKKVRNSDEIATWDVHLVHQNDEFQYELGDNPHIAHRPALGNRGPIIAAYSIATLKSGERSREVMTIDEIFAIRDRYSDAWKAFKANKIKSTPWNDSVGEMAKKTVARRHSKVLPMNTDLDELMRREDGGEEAIEEIKEAPPRKIGNASALDQFAETVGNGNGKREEPSAESPPDDMQQMLDDNAESQDAEAPTGELVSAADAYARGRKDRDLGRHMRATPVEWRAEGFETQAEAWQAGWLARDDEITKAKAKK